MGGFCVGYAFLLIGAVINAKIKNMQFKETNNDDLLVGTKDSNISIVSEQKSEQNTILNEIGNVTKIYPMEIADKMTIFHTWSTVALLIISLITFILLLVNGFHLWMIALISLITIGIVLIVIDFKKFKATQTQVDKWNNKGKAYAQQTNSTYIEMTIEKANRGIKNKFFFWLTKNRACTTKAIISILSFVVIGVAILTSIFTGFGAIINPVGDYKYDYSFKSGYGAECYELLIIKEDNTYVETTYYYGNKSSYETGTWEKFGSSLYIYAQNRYDDHGSLTWTFNSNSSYPEQTNFKISIGEMISGTTVWIKN